MAAIPLAVPASEDLDDLLVDYPATRWKSQEDTTLDLAFRLSQAREREHRLRRGADPERVDQYTVRDLDPRARRFSHWAVARSDLHARDKVLLQTMLLRTDGEQDLPCGVYAEQLSRDTGMSVREVENRTKRLEELGWLREAPGKVFDRPVYYVEPPADLFARSKREMFRLWQRPAPEGISDWLYDLPISYKYHSAIRFAWERTILTSRLPTRVKGVAFALALFANSSGDHPFRAVSTQELSAMTGYSAPSIIHAIKQLSLFMGLIEKRYTGLGRGHANEYRLRLPAAAIVPVFRRWLGEQAFVLEAEEPELDEARGPGFYTLLDHEPPVLSSVERVSVPSPQPEFLNGSMVNLKEEKELTYIHIKNTPTISVSVKTLFPTSYETSADPLKCKNDILTPTPDEGISLLSQLEAAAFQDFYDQTFRESTGPPKPGEAISSSEATYQA